MKKLNVIILLLILSFGYPIYSQEKQLVIIEFIEREVNTSEILVTKPDGSIYSIDLQNPIVEYRQRNRKGIDGNKEYNIQKLHKEIEKWLLEGFEIRTSFNLSDTRKTRIILTKN